MSTDCSTEAIHFEILDPLLIVLSPILHYNAKYGLDDAHICSAIIFDLIFSPSVKEIEQARRIATAAAHESGGVSSLDGFMINALIIERARKVLDLADRQ